MGVKDGVKGYLKHAADKGLDTFKKIRISLNDLPVDMPNVLAKESLRHFAQDLKNFDPVVFASTDFKYYIDDLPADRHFKELRIIPVQELVFYDIKEDEAPLQPGVTESNTGESGGVHLDAKEYHEMLKKDNAVVIDVRNQYETIIWRFDGQQSVGGASYYIDPMMEKAQMENVTVPASEVEFTDNGKKGKNPSSGRLKELDKKQTDKEERAAQSVLKWGGGHAAQKKLGRQMKRTICRFGADCYRKDCFFAHPEREQKGAKRAKSD
eukprot:CAMPEP_0176015180 /NCGR_PEP_ID=MMETSP0120_2-20121206/7204_1 /TAXON_ID=160619 /ORGANISM="Kryptoperidinium foliaceum, Strain CCMP 1326" /LENGTH=266 /DNA_ID=CAMNT_0017348141 /DNA_START=56 /DNA_END=858 /DNA_ORIENTATION=+